MTNPLAQDLGGVVLLLEKATPGELLARVIERDGQFRDAFVVVPSKIQGTSVVGDYPMEWMADDSYHEADDEWQKAHDARATAAAVNFLRTHSAEIAGALRDAERWQPIESAPRDGTYILLGYAGSHSEEGRWMGDASRNHWGETGWFASDDDVLCEHPSKPTHWRPLPAPPTQESAMQQGGGGGEAAA